jgi:hypothetical protein
MKPLAMALFAASLAGLAACGSPAASKNPPPPPDTARPVTAKGGDIDSWTDADKYVGQRVTVVGRLGSVRGVHGTVTTRGGLVIGLPNLDVAARGIAWYDWLDRNVEVSGVLHAPGRKPGGMASFDGPVVEAEPDSFRLVE